MTSDGNYPPGAIVVGLGGSGELTPSGLARATRDAALEHALGWLAQPDERVKVSDGAIGLSSVLLGSYGVAGMTLPAALAAIVEGVVLANGLLAERTGPQPLRIGVLEIVERYSEPAEDAARVLRHIDRLLPAALRATSGLRPDRYMHLGEGGRPALPTAEYGAGMWHRLIVTTRSFDERTRVKELQFTSLGSRARADQLVQPVDTLIVGRMVKDAVAQTSVDPRVNSALFELLLPNEVKRELAAVENLQLVLDAGAADFPWEALTDRGALTGTGPFARKAGFLRQLSLPSPLRPDPASGSGGALVVGDPPGDPKCFRRLDGARHEAEQHRLAGRLRRESTGIETCRSHRIVADHEDRVVGDADRPTLRVPPPGGDPALVGPQHARPVERRAGKGGRELRDVRRRHRTPLPVECPRPSYSRAPRPAR